ncbi:MAG: FprA family A-type flavoprotein [Ruminococcaceae bacterium]|nr:FprA family A-type flavoprotein [Oscillospiraceae bacterium]
MSMMQLKDGIYSVGALNPNMRTFDIIMHTEYGTSYNAYIVRGEKTALIDTVHGRFFDEYLENVRRVVDIKEIDYIISNHTEPDHSGSIRYLLEENPDITVVSTMAGKKYLGKIVNRDFRSMVVKNGDTLDLGGKTLTFRVAPFLHWPDSMFTYVNEDKVLFSCDMFGCHYCEPRMFDDRIAYPAKYDVAFKEYYDAIFSPFTEFVLAGIEKISDLDYDMVCPSHGPILVAGIEKAIETYRNWSTKTVVPVAPKKTVIVYVSAYGCTKRLAQEIKSGIESVDGNQVVLMDALKHDLFEIKAAIDEADGVVVGSPTINKDALKPIWDVLSVIEVLKNKDKPCGVFGSYGWSGEGFQMLEERLKGLKLKLFGESVRANFVPDDAELKNAYDWAVGFAAQL